MKNLLERLRQLTVILTLLALTFGAAGVTPVHAATITVAKDANIAGIASLGKFAHLVKPFLKKMPDGYKAEIELAEGLDPNRQGKILMVKRMSPLDGDGKIDGIEVHISPDESVRTVKYSKGVPARGEGP